MIQKPYSKVALVDIIQIINVKCNLIINNLCGRSLWINFKIISLMVKIHIHYCGLKIKKKNAKQVYHWLITRYYDCIILVVIFYDKIIYLLIVVLIMFVQCNFISFMDTVSLHANTPHFFIDIIIHC